jgi:hypothetical protein
MIDTSDLSVVIPFRSDSPDRRENLDAVVRFFARFARGHELIILEDGKRSAASGLADLPNVKYRFEWNDGPFHKTRLLNRGVLELSSRRFVASYDADTLLFPEALKIAMDRLRDGKCLVLPFSGDLFDVRRSARAALIKSLGFENISASALLARRGKLGFDDLVHFVYIHDTHVGGAVLFDRSAFVACGGYNENFVSWGYEDNEIVERFVKLGVELIRVAEYPLLHLSHRRGADSGKHNPYFRNNVVEYRRMSQCAPQEVRDLISTGGLRRRQLPPVGRAQHFKSVLWKIGAYFGIR